MVGAGFAGEWGFRCDVGFASRVGWFFASEVVCEKPFASVVSFSTMLGYLGHVRARD